MGRVIVVSALERGGEALTGQLAGLGWPPVWTGRLAGRLPDPPAMPAGDLLVADLAGAADPAALVAAQSAAEKLGLPLVCRLKAAEVAALLEARPGLVLGRLWLDHWEPRRVARLLAEAAPATPPPNSPACRLFCARLRESERGSLCEMLRLIGQNLPDLVWAKDLADRFLYVNQAMCDKLLQCADAGEALGRGDLYFADRERAAGHRHTFGELCLNSDKVVKRTGQAGVFLEEGLVRGQRLSLQVHKAPIRNERQEMVGTVGVGRDVTAELAISRRLAESEQRHRAIVDNLEQGILVAQDGVVKFANSWFARVFGLDTVAAVGQPIESFVHPEDRERVVDNHRRRTAGQPAPSRYGLRILDATGQTRWVLLSAIKAEWEGRPATMGFITDITERLEAERDLKAQEERFRTLVENLPGLVFRSELRAPWRVEYMSEGALAVTGHGAADFISQRMDFGRIILPADLPGVERAVERAVANREPYQVEYRIRHAGGGVRWVLERGRAVYNEHGAPLCLDGMILNITRQKRAEAQRKLSEEKFTKAFKASPVWVSITTVDEGRFLEVNDAFTATTGYSREEAIGRTSFDLDFWLDPARDRAPALAALRSQGRFRNLETRMRFKDGRIRTMLWSADPIDHEGRSCLLNVLTDITEFKQVEEEKAALERQLRQSQKMEAVGTLAGGIAHDFNNLLAAITGYAELGLELAGQGKDNSADIRQVLAATERARRLVRQILTFSRRAESRLRPLDINREAAETARMLERTIPKMIALGLDLADGLPAVNADPVQVDQILLNLAANAQDAMPDGGELTIATRRLRLEKDLNQEQDAIPAGEYVLLSVADTGHGIDDETRQHIFEPFFTTKAVGKGTGLGLATVFGVVKGHHGHVVCHSAAGQGSRFDIYLPALAQASAGPDGPGREPAAVRGGPETILVVDDEPGLVAVARRSLESQGYRVFTANSGEQALEFMGGDPGRVDLILLDLGMPGMGGARCLREIIARDPAARVVIATGYAPDTLADPDLGAAAGYLAKPYRRAALLEAVRRALDA